MSDLFSNPRSAVRLGLPAYIPALGLLLLFGVLAAAELHQISKGNVGAFGTYYAAASALREGRNPYGQTGSYPYVYPPFYAFLCQPLARLGRSAAAQVMLAVNIVLVVAALLLGSRSVLTRFGRAPNASEVLCVALTGTVIAIVPIHKEFLSLQSDPVLLLSLVLAIVWLDKQPLLSGLALAVGISVKFVPFIAVPYLLWRRRLMAAGATVVGCVLIAMMPAISIGWSNNIRYFTIANRGLAHIVGLNPAAPAANIHPLADPLNISVTSALARLAETNDWPKNAALAITAIVFFSWLAAIMMQYRSRRLPFFLWPASSFQRAPPFHDLIAVEWAGLLTAAMAFSPNTIFLLAVFPAVVFASLPLRSPTQYLNRRVIAGTGLLFTALLLPISAMGHSLTTSWNSTAASSWLMLISYLILYASWSEQHNQRPDRLEYRHNPPARPIILSSRY